MRLFAALYPPPDVLGHLAAAVSRAEPELVDATVSGGNVRLIPADRWHLTVAFYGEDDLDARAEKLSRRVRQLRVRAPWLRCAGAGTFGGVLWIGVHPAPGFGPGMLRTLARAGGVDPEKYQAHVTVARWSTGRPDRRALVSPLAGYVGPWWRPTELLLVRSDLDHAGPRYQVVHRVPLPPADEPAPE